MLPPLLLEALSLLPAREVRLVMGTAAEVRVAGVAEPSRALDAAFAALDRVDERLSLWRESELRALNRSGSAIASAELLAVLHAALDVAQASDGAFDPTVEPLVRAAGHLDEPARELTAAQRARLLASVGARHVHIQGRRVLLDPGTRVDFGGIAKGYAVDLALAALRAAGATSGFVDLGGSSQAIFGETLQLSVRDPVDAEAPPWAKFELTGAVGSSGGSERPGHILDPRTGRPARDVLAATVVAATAMEADALGTAVFVLGVPRGLALLARRGASGFVLLREGDVRVLRATPGFAVAHALRTAPGVEVRP